MAENRPFSAIGQAVNAGRPRESPGLCLPAGMTGGASPLAHEPAMLARLHRCRAGPAPIAVSHFPYHLSREIL